MFGIERIKQTKNKVITEPVNKVRSNCVIGFVGAQKTGKSSMQEEMARKWRSKRPLSNQIWGFDYQHVFKLRKDGGILDKEIHIGNPEWAVECNQLRNGLLIADEIKLLSPLSQHNSKGMPELFSQCFYRNVDLFWSCHNPSSTPDIVTHFTTHYFIFLTFAKEGSFRKKIPNYALCTEASEEVNTYVSVFGKGKHRNDPEYKGEGFPHIIVDTEKQKLIRQNMPHYDKVFPGKRI